MKISKNTLVPDKKTKTGAEVVFFFFFWMEYRGKLVGFILYAGHKATDNFFPLSSNSAAKTVHILKVSRSFPYLKRHDRATLFFSWSIELKKEALRYLP